MKINYRVLNLSCCNKETPIVIIHGLFGSLDNLNMLAYPLSKTNCIIQVDLRNHGLSHNHPNMSYETMAKDIINLIDHFLIKKCIIIGYSMGGKIAMKLCFLQPKRFEKVIIIDIAPVNYNNLEKENIFFSLKKIKKLAIIKRIDAFQMMRKEINNIRTIQFLLKSFHNGKWKFNINYIETNYYKIINWKNQLPCINRILFIFGEKSPYFKKNYYSTIFQQFPFAKIKIVSNCGHWLHCEKYLVVLNIVKIFLFGK